jgi:hypothetical protein
MPAPTPTVATLTLSVPITPEKLARAEQVFREVVPKLAEQRRRKIRENGLLFKHRAIWHPIIYLLATLGIGLLPFARLSFGPPGSAALLRMLLLAFFIGVILLFALKQRIGDALWAWPLTPAVRRRSTKVFAAARPIAPFVANYTLHGKAVVYARTKEGVTTPCWRRTVQGEFYIAPDFVIFYGKWMLFPGVFMLIESETGLVDYLQGLGLLRMRV